MAIALFLTIRKNTRKRYLKIVQNKLLMPKKIYLAEVYGFCFGVRRALDMTLKQNKGSVTLGPLIHNRYVIDELMRKGICYINSINMPKNGTVIIRAHGVPKQVVEEAKQKKLNIVDATCPLVKKVHIIAQQLEKEGFQVIVVGDKKHAEVVGIRSYLKDSIIIEKPEQVSKLKSFNKIGVVAQTTQSGQNFKEIVKRLRKKCKKLKAVNTICSSTEQRQKAALKLAKKVEMMLIVGDVNSANTRRLKELCSEIIDTKQVDNSKGLKVAWFKDKNKIGITAGASTPEKLVKEVVNRISTF